VDVIKKHAQWFNYLGIDWILIDWTNMLWMTPPWEAHSGGTKELEETAELFIKTYAEMDREGKPVPRLVFMLSPGNGALAPDGFARTNTIIAYLKSHYFDRPEYKNLWLYYGGKPLLTLLHYVPHGQCEAVQKGESSIVAPGLTIRWMGTQLQDNPGGSCGMWSWMDGTVRQMVTRRDGKAEETVVTPASFLMRDGPTLGWSDASTTAPLTLKAGRLRSRTIQSLFRFINGTSSRVKKTARARDRTTISSATNTTSNSATISSPRNLMP
jgi:hypothetical protein